MEKRKFNVIPKNVKELKKMIIDHGLTLKGFCEEAGVSQPTMDKILYKNHNPYPPVAKRIADTLGFKISDIFFTDGVQK